MGDIEVLPDQTVCVRCPWHSWCYDLATGQLRRPKGRNIRATVYPTKVTENGTILVGFEEIAAEYFTKEDF